MMPFVGQPLRMITTATTITSKITTIIAKSSFLPIRWHSSSIIVPTEAISTIPNSTTQNLRNTNITTNYNIPSPTTTNSDAEKILQRRAIQCSFSSVFHLREAGMKHNDANFVENLFIVTVGVPIAIMAVTGLYVSITS